MATKASTKKTAAKKTTKTTAKKKPTKKTVKKATVKKAVTKKAATKKPAAKKKTAPKKSPAKKATAKKATTKKTAVKTVKKTTTTSKKTATKKTNKTTKAASKKTMTKKAAPKKSSAASKAKSSGKAKVKKPVSATVESVIEETPPSPKTKATTKKSTTKKTTKRKSSKKSSIPRPPVVGKVGQAPRRTSEEVAASNPFPVPPRINDSLSEDAIQPTAESKAAKKDFKVNDEIVYPAHGVGVIEAIESQQIVGMTIEVFVIRFEHEKLTLRVPTQKAKAVGMRDLSDPEFVEKTIKVLQGRARIKRTMWSRRAQEYEAKINSGDLNAVAEVVRDLYRAPEQPEQSYSERQLFEAALDRMAREVAAVKKVDLSESIDQLDASLQKKQIPVT